MSSLAKTLVETRSKSLGEPIKENGDLMGLERMWIRTVRSRTRPEL